MLLRATGRHWFLKTPDGRIVYFGKGINHGGYIVPSPAWARRQLYVAEAWSVLAVASPLAVLQFSLWHALAALVCGITMLWLSEFWSRLHLPQAHFDITADDMKAARNWTRWDLGHDALITTSAGVLLTCLFSWATRPAEPYLVACTATALGVLVAVPLWDWWTGRLHEISPDAWIPSARTAPPVPPALTSRIA